MTLSCAADAAPPEVSSFCWPLSSSSSPPLCADSTTLTAPAQILAMFAKKARLDASAAAAFGVFERRAPAAHQVRSRFVFLCFVSLSTCRFVDVLICRFVDVLICRFVDLLICRFVDFSIC